MSQTCEVSGVSVEYQVQGHGTTGVVLLSGESVPMQAWSKVVGQLPDVGPILRYNR